ncbi:cuticle protein 8-like [Armigeres subalbatus]|uniref:cuticle protein 8-like n=1 Tax=Armigeres subalbatus TaxID=124917 RepID=UPI002ED4EC3B
MAFKFVVLATLLAAANAGVISPHGYASSHQSIQLQHAAPVHHVAAVHAAPIHHVASIHAAPVHHALVKEVEHHAPANYEFAYSVHDEHTGDIKSQHETRHGDEVHGQYSLLDSDGHHRIVDYHADHHSGFNAVVRREPANVKIAQPVHKVIAAPVHVASHAIAPVHHQIAPVHHAAISHHHAAPVIAQVSHHQAAPVVLSHSAHHVAPVHHASISHIAPVAHYSHHDGHHAGGYYSHY